MRALAVFRKEMLETLNNRLLLSTLIPLPLLFVAIPIIMIVLLNNASPTKQGEVDAYYRLSPAFANMDPGIVLQIVLLGQFMMMLLMTPVIVPMTISTFSIIGEKQAHSLEPLLATPITTLDLLLGKVMAAVLPAVLMTWVAYCLLLAGMAIVAPPEVFASVSSDMWILVMAVVAPLLALLSVNLGVLISSRVNDTRAAQQIGALVVFPIVGLGIAQTAGQLLLSPMLFLMGAIAIAILDVAVLALAVRLFQRERILTEWK